MSWMYILLRTVVCGVWGGIVLAEILEGAWLLMEWSERLLCRLGWGPLDLDLSECGWMIESWGVVW